MDLFPSTLAFIGDLAGPEMLLVLVIVLVLFGGDKLPEFARGLGKSIREFKKAATNVEEEFKRAMEEDEKKHLAPPTPTPFPAYTPAPTLAAAEQPQLNEAPPADTATMKLAEPPLAEPPVSDTPLSDVPLSDATKPDAVKPELPKSEPPPPPKATDDHLP